MNSQQQRRPFAVVTGASSGIGFELAKVFAEEGFEALMDGEERVVAGSFKNKAQVAAGKVLPDSIKAEMHRKQAQPAAASERNN